MKKLIAMVVGLAAGIVWASPAYKAELTVSGYAGAEALADFPVLVRISPQTIAGFDYGQCLDGATDLSFCKLFLHADLSTADSINPNKPIRQVGLPSPSRYFTQRLKPDGRYSAAPMSGFLTAPSPCTRGWP